jgi:hypothetical protein
MGYGIQLPDKYKPNFDVSSEGPVRREWVSRDLTILGQQRDGNGYQ